MYLSKIHNEKGYIYKYLTYKIILLQFYNI